MSLRVCKKWKHLQGITPQCLLRSIIFFSCWCFWILCITYRTYWFYEKMFNLTCNTPNTSIRPGSRLFFSPVEISCVFRHRILLLFTPIRTHIILGMIRIPRFSLAERSQLVWFRIDLIHIIRLRDSQNFVWTFPCHRHTICYIQTLRTLLLWFPIHIHTYIGWWLCELILGRLKTCSRIYVLA